MTSNQAQTDIGQRWRLTKLNQFVDRTNEPHGLNLAKMFSSILLKRNFDSVGSWHVRSLFLGMMHFQDKYNEDLERLQRCDIHYLTPDLRIIPFCAFNVIPEWYRDRIQKKFSIPVEEWEKAHGQTLEAGLYRGLMRKGKPEAEMGCALSEMHKSVVNLLLMIIGVLNFETVWPERRRVDYNLPSNFLSFNFWTWIIYDW